MPEQTVKMILPYVIATEGDIVAMVKDLPTAELLVSALRSADGARWSDYAVLCMPTVPAFQDGMEN